MSGWIPQPGPQAAAAICPVKIIMYGGSRGGGKSDTTIGRQIIGAQQHGPHWNGVILRRRYKDLAELRRRIRELIRLGAPGELVGGDQQPGVWRWPNGAEIRLETVQRIEDCDTYQGQQKTEFGVEEATNFPFITDMVDRLLGALRSPHGVRTAIFMTANPGGVGHTQVKSMMIDPAPPGRLFQRGKQSAVFIPSRVYDNQILVRNDPSFVEGLESISDPVLRDAWLNGNWDIFEGQAFAFKRAWHVIEPRPIPEAATIIQTFDWGWGAPFSVGWWYRDGEGRLIRFAEWYGYSGKPNTGVRKLDEEIAEGIIERERQMNIQDHPIKRFAGHDSWNAKPDYKANDPGPSTAQVFASYGLYMIRANADRQQKIRQFRSRLHVETDADGNPKAPPMLQVFETCTHFIRTIPDLALSVDNPEEIDEDQEDHVYDESCQVCMAYPLRRKGRQVERDTGDHITKAAKERFF